MNRIQALKILELENVPNEQLDAKTIQRVYKKMCVKYHPDKHKDADKKCAEEQFKKVGDAYQVLSSKNEPSRGGGFDTVSVDMMDAFELFNQVFGNRGFAKNPMGRMQGMQVPLDGFSNIDFTHMGVDGNHMPFNSDRWGSSGGVSRSETISTTVVNGRSVTKRVVTENGHVIRSEILNSDDGQFIS
tara:strand:- start:2944 stop:3504 length:561 start_codon:yes stop_codon:yes gene_type:complete